MINVVCDLDGVLYRGDTVIPGVPDALDRLADAATRLLFVTNNASRTPRSVGDKIERVAGFAADADQIVTSSMAAVRMLRPEDLPVFVVGEEGITSVLAEASYPTTTVPTEAGSVVVGITPHITYQWLAEAADAVRSGARFIATNLDPTFPIAGGFLPGAGSIVAAIATASGVEPEVAGKPEVAIRELVKEKLTGPVWVIGDRLDSDIAMASAEPDWTSVLVLTGSTPTPSPEADHVVSDLAAAVDLILNS